MKEHKIINGQLVEIEDGKMTLLSIPKRKGLKLVKVTIPFNFEYLRDIEFSRELSFEEETHYMVMAANVLLQYLNLRGVTNEKYFETGEGIGRGDNDVE